MRVIYVAHPLNGPDREANRANAAKWCAWVAQLGHAPVADWIILSGELAEADGREMGLVIAHALVRRCDEVWLVGGRVSPGMQIEADEAVRLAKPVYDLTPYGYAPPSDPPVLLTRWVR
jgi:hypothetical protein